MNKNIELEHILLKGGKVFFVYFRQLKNPISCWFSITLGFVLSKKSIQIELKYFCGYCSVEKLYNHIVKTSQPALEPLHIMQSGGILIFD